MAAELIVNNDTNTRWHQLDHRFNQQVFKNSNWAFYLSMYGRNNYDWYNTIKDAEQMCLMGGEL